MNVEEIINNYLNDHNCDGLCNPAIQCSCYLDDLMLCFSVEYLKNCEPAYCSSEIDEFGNLILVNKKPEEI